MRFKNLKIVVDLWAPPFVWALFIFSFSSIPINPVSEIHWKDFIIKKSSHVLIYGILAILLFRSLKESGLEKKKAAVLAILISVLYGLTDEYHQSSTPGREPKLRDVLFDTIGSIFAIYSVWNLLPKAPPKLKRLAKNLQIL